MQLRLNFLNVSIRIDSNEVSLVEKLKQEFHYFVATVEVPAQGPWIELFASPPPEIPSLLAHKVLENCIVYRLGGIRYIDYFGAALTVEKEEGKTEIFTEDPTRLFELAFLTIHSYLGQLLEKGGVSRVHAMAVSHRGINAVVMLPSKGGKSTLLSGLLQVPEVKLVSDDMPLVDNLGRILPFPSKMSLDHRPTEGPLAELEWHEFKRHHYPPKWTASLAQFQGRIDDGSAHNPTLLLAGFRLSRGESAITEVRKWAMFKPMMEHMIVGIGLPQIVELFLSFDWTDAPKLLVHGLRRMKNAFALVARARVYHFYLGPDRALNQRLLLELLDARAKE